MIDGKGSVKSSNGDPFVLDDELLLDQCYLRDGAAPGKNAEMPEEEPRVAGRNNMELWSCLETRLLIPKARIPKKTHLARVLQWGVVLPESSIHLVWTSFLPLFHRRTLG